MKPTFVLLTALLSLVVAQSQEELYFRRDLSDSPYDDDYILELIARAPTKPLASAAKAAAPKAAAPKAAASAPHAASAPARANTANSKASTSAPKREQSEMSKTIASKSVLLNPGLKAAAEKGAEKAQKKYDDRQNRAEKSHGILSKDKPADGRRMDGKQAAPWYQKAGHALAHPRETLSNAKYSIANKKLDFDKKGETKAKIDYETKRADYSKTIADRNKPFYDKASGENAVYNHRMRPLDFAGKVKGLLGKWKRDMEDDDLFFEFEARSFEEDDDIFFEPRSFDEEELDFEPRSFEEDGELEFARRWFDDDFEEVDY